MGCAVYCALCFAVNALRCCSLENDLCFNAFLYSLFVSLDSRLLAALLHDLLLDNKAPMEYCNYNRNKNQHMKFKELL